jgi:hypothetical protein
MQNRELERWQKMLATNIMMLFGGKVLAIVHRGPAFQM